MSTYTSNDTLEDGTPLPQPIREDTHRQGFYKSSLSKHIEYTVAEIEYPTFLLLTASCNDRDFKFGADAYFASIVALRVSQGWKIMSMTDTGASLVRP